MSAKRGSTRRGIRAAAEGQARPASAPEYAVTRTTGHHSCPPRAAPDRRSNDRLKVASGSGGLTRRREEMSNAAARDVRRLAGTGMEHSPTTDWTDAKDRRWLRQGPGARPGRHEPALLQGASS